MVKYDTCAHSKLIITYSGNIEKKKLRCVLKFHADCTEACVILPKVLDSIVLFSYNVAPSKENTCSEIAEDSCSRSVVFLKLLPRMEVPKCIASTIIEDRHYHVCEYTSINM